MHELMQVFVASAAKAFQLRGPVYWFGPPGGAGLGAAGSLGRFLGEADHAEIEMDEGLEIGRLPFPDGAARTVFCAGALEHAFQPQRMVEELTRILVPGGALLIYTRPGDTAPDHLPAFWHLTPRSVQRLLAGMETTLVGWQGAETSPHTIYGIGLKPPTPNTILAQTQRFPDGFQTQLDEVARQRRGARPWSNGLGRWLSDWFRESWPRPQRRDYDRVQFAVHVAARHGCEHDVLAGLEPETKTGGRLDLLE